MIRLRVVLIGCLLAVVVVVAISATALLVDNERRSYTPDEVATALATQGLDVSEAGSSEDGSALLPPDGSFTVVVLKSDNAARDSFEQYESDTDPDTFELLAGNVIILADLSNSDTPLSDATRAKITRAVEQLTATHG